MQLWFNRTTSRKIPTIKTPTAKMKRKKCLAFMTILREEKKESEVTIKTPDKMDNFMQPPTPTHIPYNFGGWQNTMQLVI